MKMIYLVNQRNQRILVDLDNICAVYELEQKEEAGEMRAKVFVILKNVPMPFGTELSFEKLEALLEDRQSII